MNVTPWHQEIYTVLEEICINVIRAGRGILLQVCVCCKSLANQCFFKGPKRMEIWGRTFSRKINKPWDSNWILRRWIDYRNSRGVPQHRSAVAASPCSRKSTRSPYFMVRKHSCPRLSHCWGCVEFLCSTRWWALPRHGCFSPSSSRWLTRVSSPVKFAAQSDPFQGLNLSNAWGSPARRAWWSVRFCDIQLAHTFV